MTRSDLRRTRTQVLVREGLATSLAQPVASAITTLILATVCLSILATTGQSAASEARVLNEVERAGSRTLTVSDSSGAAGLSAARIQTPSALPQVEWLFGVGPTQDVVNSTLGEAGSPVPSRTALTAFPGPIELASGRMPRKGEAIAGITAAKRLGLVDGVGVVSGEGVEAPVVGTFTAQRPLTGLGDFVLIAADPEAGAAVPLQTAFVLVRRVEDVPVLEGLLLRTLSSTDPAQLTIESPTALAQLQAVVGGEVGRNGRRLMLMVLGAGLLLVTMTQYGATMARRRDFGRRRALGASRSDLVQIVLTQTLGASLLGVLLGLGFGLLIVQGLAGQLPVWQFSVGVGILALLASLVAATPPAILAARADPSRILRVP